MKEKTNMRRRSLIIFLLTAVLLLTAIPASGYLEGTYGLKGAANLGINLFFDNLSTEKPAGGQSALEKYQATIPNLTAEEKVWGHIGNPYVISHSAHLQNLSKLQNSGFFAEQFPKTKPGAAGPFTRDDMPYFLVCTKEGNAVAVGNASIAPVGNEQFPFIGSVKGYGSGSPQLSCGKNAPGSTIDRVTVNAIPGEIDLGFFGKIGCLGTRPAAGSTAAFEGIPSELSNLIFSDIQISLTADSQPNPAGHVFFRDLLADAQKAQVYANEEFPNPNETHHLGILVGHVEYAKIQNISIYYSTNNFAAIQLSGQNADQNFLCATGYFGLIDNLNPESDGNGGLVAGSGLNNSDISYGYGGGGGTLSGTNPGYIRAKEFADKYGGSADPATGDIIMISAEDAEKKKLAQPAIEDHLFWKSTGGYYFYDGIFTFALSDHQNLADPSSLDRISDIWEPETTTMETVMVPKGFRMYTLPGYDRSFETSMVQFICEPEDTEITVWRDASADAHGQEEIPTMEETVPDQTETVPADENLDSPLAEETELKQIPEQSADSTIELSLQLQEPQKDGYYLTPGKYYYTARRDGYFPIEKEAFTVDSRMKTVEIRVNLAADESALPPEESTIPEPIVPDESEPSASESSEATEMSTTPSEEPTMPAGIVPASTVPATEQTAEVSTQPANAETEVPDTTDQTSGDEKTETVSARASADGTIPAEETQIAVQVYFHCTPEQLELAVWQMVEGEKIDLIPENQKEQPSTEEKNMYLLIPGEYYYSARYEGYDRVAEQTFTVEAAEAEQEIIVELTVRKPMETVHPSEPAETTVPSEPAETTAPSEPAETTVPSEPAETTVPSEPAETTAPSEPVETTVPSEPIETTVPSEPAETTAPSEPIETTVPSEPAETIVPDESMEPTVSGESTAPSEEKEGSKPGLIQIQGQKVPETLMGIPKFNLENRQAVTGVDTIDLSQTWVIGQKGMKTYYDQILTEVTTNAQLDSLIDIFEHPENHPGVMPPLGFYVGCPEKAGTRNTFGFMDLTTEQNGNNDRNSKVIKQSSAGELLDVTVGQQQQNRLRFGENTAREAELKYLLNIHKNADGTYILSGQNTEKTDASGNPVGNPIRLGVFNKFWDALWGTTVTVRQLKALYENDTNGRTGNYSYNFDFNMTPHTDAQGNTQWKLISPVANDTVIFTRDGTSFRIGTFGGGEAAPFSIYAVYQDHFVNRSDYYYVSEEASTQSFPANEYVLWPNQEYSGSTSGKHMENSYSLRYLPDLHWNDQNGKPIWPDPGGTPDAPAKLEGLTKMFDMKKTVDWTVQGELLGFNLGNIGSKGKMLQVPVGTGSYKKNVVIPTGSLAFHINKQFSPDKPGKIRVIVKVPSSALDVINNTPDEAGGIKDYYLGLWKGETRKQGILNFYGFNKDTALKIVEMPLSERMVPTHDNPNLEEKPIPPTAEEEANAQTRVISVTYPYAADKPGSTPATYQTYLQGETVMLAYEFHVTDPGVYILAASDSAMQIAYCSADGIASAGRDGTGGAALGNIDFVYDNGTSVLPVTQRPQPTPQGQSAEENPNLYYYESNVMLHFNNLESTASGYPRTKNVAARIYRSILGAPLLDGVTTQIELTRGGDPNEKDHVKIDPFHNPHDQVIVDGTVQ